MATSAVLGVNIFSFIFHLRLGLKFSKLFVNLLEKISKVIVDTINAISFFDIYICLKIKLKFQIITRIEIFVSLNLLSVKCALSSIQSENIRMIG